MTSVALLARLLALGFVLAVVQAGWNAAQLPALSAAWFDAAGRPIWFVPTAWLAWAHVGVAALVAIGTAVGLRGKGHGDGADGRAAAPDDRAAVRDVRERRRASERAAFRVAALGFATVLALAAIAQQVYDANRAPIPALDVRATLAAAVFYGIFLIGWLWVARGRRPSRVR